MLRILLVCSLVTGAVNSLPANDEWGTLVLRIRCTDIPANAVRNEAFLADAEKGDLANVMVWLDRKIERVHPSHSVQEKLPIEVKLVQGRLLPRAVIMRTTQTLVIAAADQTFNPNFSPGRGNPATSVILSSGKSLEYRFKRALVFPADLTCSITPSAKAQVLALDHPYFGVTNHEGMVTIANVPTGKHELRLWHERGFLSGAIKKDRLRITDRGNLQIDVTPGINDLGIVDVPYDKLMR